MKKTTINELMGSGGDKAKTGKLTVADLPNLLGERMPKLEFTPIGRMRLATALRNRFGDNYKHLAGIEDLMREFDREAEFNVKKAEMKLIKGKR